LGKSPCWTNYFLCGVKGALEHLTDSQSEAVANIGFQFAVAGNIPESSGLSSSSALVTAAAMATLVGYGVSVRVTLFFISVVVPNRPEDACPEGRGSPTGPRAYGRGGKVREMSNLKLTVGIS